MYTAIKLGHADDRQTQRRIVTIRFIHSVTLHEFIKDFSFRLTDTIEVMRATVNSYLIELNAVPDVLPDGTVNTTITPPVVIPPTVAELERQAWEKDEARIKKVQALIDCGVVFSNPQLSAFATLRTRIATNLKAEYLG